jgi:peptide/nickel transport system substrate-binding protein
LRKPIALILATLLIVAMFAACGGDTVTSPDPSAPATSNAPVSSAPLETPNPAWTLVASNGEMNGKFSPFTGESAYDMAVSDLVMGPSLVSYDRVGELVFNGIDGETREYNGNAYTYTGLADGSVTYDEAADVTTYHLKLREDVTFSDGQPLTIDDVIFTYYAFLDPSYTGSSTLYSVQIQGLEDYRTGFSTAYNKVVDAIWAAGPTGATSGADYTAEQFNLFWTAFTTDTQGIVDYVFDNYAETYAEGQIGHTVAELEANDGLKVALGMVMWGFGGVDDAGVLAGGVDDSKTWDLTATFPTIEDYVYQIAAAYGSYEEAGGVEFSDSGNSYPDVKTDITKAILANPSSIQRAATNVSGIHRLGDYELEVLVDGYNASAVYNVFGIQPAPLHYYGDTSKYDYANDQFGFDYADTAFMKEKEPTPLGAGPYKFVKYENKIVYFEANETYWKGVPKIKNVQYKGTDDADKIPGITTGTLDIADPSVNLERVDQIKGFNSNGELNGDVLDYLAVNNLGYGYVGLNAKTVSIGGERSSEASKNLRKGLATILAVYRDVTVDSFYGDTASVINYPISLTSWAAPQRTDPGYKVAYSTDVDGNEIYTSDMDLDARAAAAAQAALGFLEKAGYTVADGKVTAAPDGGRTSFEALIPGQGQGDHPSFLLLTSASALFATIGIDLQVNDLSNSTVLWDALDAETADIWCAAWGATLDPDIYQLYHSDGLVGSGTGANHYGIDDPDLDEYIVESRSSTDNNYRKEVFLEAFNVILDHGVEVPVYQRENCFVFSSQRIKLDTLPGDMTTYWLWSQEVENIELQ